jgi:hypothetical protein
MKDLPPAPPGWNKTIRDLMAEVDSGARRSVGSPEIDWARDYERSLLPADTRFPCEGETYEALEDCCVTYITSWAAPYSGGGTATLMRGERITIRFAPKGSRPIMIYADPAEYRVLESRIVPLAERRAASYEGYHLAIATVELNKKFRLVGK